MTRVNVRTLKDKLSKYLDRARKGESIEVTRRGAAVALLVPPGPHDDTEAKLRQLEAEGLLIRPKNPPGWTKHPAMKVRRKKLPSEMLLEDRRSRY